MAGKLRVRCCSPRSSCRALVCSLLLVGVAAWAADSGTDTPSLLAAPVAASNVGASATAPAAVASTISASPVAGPAVNAAGTPDSLVLPHKAPSAAWNELSIAQQVILRPLAEHWDQISEFNRRKWLTMASNFNSLPQAEQDRLRARMTEWASLSPQQRSQARLNFAKSRQLSAQERLAKWEAYQALTPEQKKLLAAKAPKRPLGAAPALRLSAQQKQALAAQALLIDHQRADRSANRVGPRPSDLLPLLDPHTLLPRSRQTNKANPQP